MRAQRKKSKGIKINNINQLYAVQWNHRNIILDKGWPIFVDVQNFLTKESKSAYLSIKIDTFFI